MTPPENPPDFFAVVHSQRAARSFLPDDVDDATVARILTAATHAPSAENSQPFVFVVVRDATLRAAIGALTARLWEGGAKALEDRRVRVAVEIHPPRRNRVQNAAPIFGFDVHA